MSHYEFETLEHAEEFGLENLDAGDTFTITRPDFSSEEDPTVYKVLGKVQDLAS